MRGLKLLAFCFLSGTACAQATGPSAPVLNQTFSTRISSLTLSTENLTGISKSGSADLIYALRLETKRQNPSMPEEFGGLSSLSFQAIDGDTITFDALTDQGHLARVSAPNPMTWGTAAPPVASEVHLTTLTDAADKPLV